MNNALEEALLMMDAYLLDKDGLPHPVPAELLQKMPYDALRLWANRRGIYQFITCEQVEWTKKLIDGRSAIEICAGHGTLGRALGIPSIDSKLQTRPDMIAKYEKIGAAVIQYPDDVIKMEAIEAIKHYKPAVVVGCYVTQWGPCGMTDTPSSPFGVKEWEFFDHGVNTYIVFGNKNSHANKWIYSIPHVELEYPWLFTRGVDPKLNRVWVFDMPESYLQERRKMQLK